MYTHPRFTRGNIESCKFVKRQSGYTKKDLTDCLARASLPRVFQDNSSGVAASGYSNSAGLSLCTKPQGQFVTSVASLPPTFQDHVSHKPEFVAGTLIKVQPSFANHNCLIPTITGAFQAPTFSSQELEHLEDLNFMPSSVDPSPSSPVPPIASPILDIFQEWASDSFCGGVTKSTTSTMIDQYFQQDGDEEETASWRITNSTEEKWMGFHGNDLLDFASKVVSSWEQQGMI